MPEAKNGAQYTPRLKTLYTTSIRDKLKAMQQQKATGG